MWVANERSLEHHVILETMRYLLGEVGVNPEPCLSCRCASPAADVLHLASPASPVSSYFSLYLITLLDDA